VITPQGGSITLRVFAVAVTLAMLPSSDGWAATETPASSAPATPLPEVMVTARRLELERRVAKFVNQIAAPENGDEGLARWQRPVCPLVSGLPQKDGEFILERLSEVAHAAGVPLGDEHCHPNLYILVTDQPEDLLRGMEKRNRGFTFGYDTSVYPPTETPATVVDEFINTPHAVRVWYNSYEKDIWDNPVAYCPASDILPGKFGHATVLYIRCSRGIAGGSHLVSSAIWAILRAFVIVDQNRLHEVKLGQLADYVAMSGFAKLKPGAHLDDAPTILTLFDGAPKAAPTGMTAWDQTFLKSLYATEQKSKLQRSEIARSMVREIAP
jgi:hypothetical protein